MINKKILSKKAAFFVIISVLMLCFTAYSALAAVWVPGVVMTDFDAPAPYTATTDLPAGVNLQAWRAFDGVIGNGNSASGDFQLNSDNNTGWLLYDLGVGNATIINQYNMTASNYSGRQYDWESWGFAGSNDNSTWVTLDNQTGISFAQGGTNSYSFDNNDAYRFYKWSLFDNNGGAGATLLAEARLIYDSNNNASYANVMVLDSFDGSALSGLSVNLGYNLTNTTDSNGIAFFPNINGQTLNFSVNGGPNYFNTTGTATENNTYIITIYGAFINISAYNVAGFQLQNYTACPSNTTFCNSTNNLYTTKLLLKPNSTNNITVEVYDTWNGTHVNYYNLTYPLNTTSQDLGLYNITGLYQSILTINATLGITNTIVYNYTVNISSNSSAFNSSYTTQTGLATFYVVNDNFTINLDPLNYSLSQKNITIGTYNFTPYVRFNIYALNSFYLNILDEISRDLLEDPFTIELISEATAGNYSTSNGSYVFEILTPADYTIRYRSNNYYERDYYQTLVDKNYYDINLYSLTKDNSTTMTVYVKDTIGNPVEGAVIKLLRYYVYSNSYEVVEMAETSFAGEAYFNVDAYDGHYKFMVDYNDESAFISSSPENLIPGSSGVVTRTIIISTGSDYYESYNSLSSIGRSLVFNNATNTLTFSWNDPSGLVSEACLVVEYLNGIKYDVFNSSCSNSTSGSLPITLTNYGNTTYKYYASIETDTTYSDYILFSGFLDKLPLYNFGKVGVFLGAGILMVLGGLSALISGVAVLVVAVFGTIALSLLGFMPMSITFITGFATLIIGISVYLMRN